MSDIFISYSRKDAKQVIALADRLRSEGASVWMDTAALAGAETWSAEIVNAIEGCTYFIVMLSPHSVASANVTKEVSLASESKKTIIPIELERCPLNAVMKYALAGVQKVKIHDEVALHRTLSKLGIVAGANVASVPTQVYAQISHSDSGPTRLAVLPFEDLSPQHDNEWFSDGLTNELISTLTRLPELYVIDRQTSKMYKGAKLSSKQIADELDVRYLVTGEVRKAGEKIRIQASLLDTTNGRTLWDEKFNGTMDDIFEIQEKTAVDITAGLRLQLTPEDERSLEAKLTESVEAYELYLRAAHLRDSATKEAAIEIIRITNRAIELDPGFAEAYVLQVEFHMFLYRVYGQDPHHHVEAERLINTALEVRPGHLAVRRQLAWLYYRQEKYSEAEALLLDCLNTAPNDYKNLEAVADFYYWRREFDKSVPYFEQAHQANPDALRPIQALCFIYQLDDTTPAQLKHWSHVGLPLILRRLKNQPNDENLMLEYVALLIYNGQHDAAADYIKHMPPVGDARSLFNLGVMLIHLNDKSAAAASFMNALEKGFTWFDGFDHDELDDEAFSEVHATVARKKAELAESRQPQEDATRG